MAEPAPEWPGFSPKVQQALALLDEMTSDERGFVKHVLIFAGNTGPRQKAVRQGDHPLPIRMKPALSKIDLNDGRR